MDNKKRCTKCGKLKQLDDFYKHKTSPDGHAYHCKTCRIKATSQYHIDNLSPEDLFRYNRNKARKKLFKKGKFICSKCNEIKPLTEFYKDSQTPHGYSYSCKDCEDKKKKKYRDKMKQDPEWVEHRRKQDKKHYHNNKKDDPQYKLNESMSGGIYRSLKGNKNGRHWEDLVGYTLDELKKHLEQQFNDKMTWMNYGKFWEIDHLIPKSTFNYTKSEHIGFKKAWALENLQPLEATKNRKKYNKLLKAKQEHLMI